MIFQDIAKDHCEFYIVDKENNIQQIQKVIDVFFLTYN